MGDRKNSRYSTSEDPFNSLSRERGVTRRVQKWNRDDEMALAARDTVNRARKTTMDGALPVLPPANSSTRMSTADLAQIPRRLGAPLTLPSRGLPGGGTPDSAGPRTVQNTGLPGIGPSASTPGGYGRMPNPPAARTPLDVTPKPATVSPNGTRTVAIEKKYQTPASEIGKGEVVGSGTKAPYTNVGTGNENPWTGIQADPKYAGILDPKHADFATHNAAFVDAWKAHAAEQKYAPGTQPTPEEFRMLADKALPAADANKSEEYKRSQAPLDTAMVGQQGDTPEKQEAKRIGGISKAASNATSGAYQFGKGAAETFGAPIKSALGAAQTVGEGIIGAYQGAKNLIKGATSGFSDMLPGAIDPLKKKKLEDLPQ